MGLLWQLGYGADVGILLGQHFVLRHHELNVKARILVSVPDTTTAATNGSHGSKDIVLVSVLPTRAAGAGQQFHVLHSQVVDAALQVA